MMQLTYYGANSWLIDLGHTRILLDPWLVDDLVFGNQSWFFRGYRQHSPTIPEQFDLILLSQGLPDHAHVPTLKQLDRTIPVVASLTGAKVAKQLNYTTVTAMKHGQTYQLDDRLSVRSLPGAPIGLQRENAYIIRDLQTKTSLYYEPHGFYADNVQDYAPVDVLIHPLANLELPLVGAIIQGQKTAMDVVKSLKPQVILPTAVGGDVEYEGILDAMLKTTGSPDEFRQQLAAQQIDAQVIEPQAGKPVDLQLHSVA